MPSFLELLESARKGDAGSQCELAMLYMTGNQVEEDESQAGRKGGQAVTRDLLILKTMGWADFIIRAI